MMSNQLLFGALPSDISKIIFELLRDKDIHSLARSSQASYAYCKPTLKFKLFFHHVFFANYRAVEIMLKENPKWMFQSWRGISPLQYAFSVYDTYMWTLFKQTAKLVMPEEEKVLFRQQLIEQQTYVDLTALSKAYYTLIKVVGSPVTDAEINEAWLTHGKVLRRLLLCGELPAHMLREFCRHGSNWHGPHEHFQLRQGSLPAPVTDSVYFFDTLKMVSLFPLLPNRGLGFDFSILRGGGETREQRRLEAAAISKITWSRYQRPIPKDIEEDVKIFDALLFARSRELDLLRYRLEIREIIRHKQAISLSS